MRTYNYKQLYAIINQLNRTGASITKEEVVEEFTSGRTTSTKEMQPHEWNNMIGTLNLKLRQSSREEQGKDLKRKKVIANMKMAGYSVDEIKLWAEKQKKLPFNQLSTSQLSELIHASQKVKEHFLSKL
jgi:hypothetical protein